MQCTGVSPEHSYAPTGSYLVTLTVTDDHAIGTTTQTIRVLERNAAPTRVFTYVAQPGSDVWRLEAPPVTAMDR